MTTYLVTGATGQLGRPTTAALRSRGHDVRALSRTAGEGRVQGDLATGRGIAQAFAGADTVVHLATTGGSADIAIAQNLVAAARTAKVGHIVLVSIVGIDRIPFAFYRDRLRIEEIVLASGLPVTVQRATQFHSFVDMIFSAQRFSPVLFAPSVRVQPIAVDEVAVRLAELAESAPVGRASDIGGPEPLTARELAGIWKTARGSRRPVLPLRLPGAFFAAYDAGAALVPGTPFGTGTFAEYVAARYR